jgi:hypothetical protein
MRVLGGMIAPVSCDVGKYFLAHFQPRCVWCWFNVNRSGSVDDEE